MSAFVALGASTARQFVLDGLRALAPPSKPDHLVAAEQRSAVPAPLESVALSDTVTVVSEASQPLLAASASGEIVWVEPRDNLWLLALKNYGLALATFGVYHFWGRVEMKRRMVNAVQVAGRRLDFTESGREAFISFALGAVIATSIVSAFVFLFVFGGAGDNGVTMNGIREFRWQRLTISLPLLFLLGSITYRKRHHNLRRTWVGRERFGLNGDAWSYAWRHFWTAFLVPLTLGWAAPWRAGTLEARKINEMEHGSLRFNAVGDMSGLYRSFALVWFGGGLLYVGMLIVLARYIGPELLAAINGLTLVPLKSWDVALTGGKIVGMALLPLIVVALLWRKSWIEYQISSIGFDGGRLQLHLPTRTYLALALSGIGLSVVSLGCFRPVAQTRMLRFIVSNIRVEGRLPTV
jgi:uncharacterized membrane protein YjgN (DUF898 family)